MKLEDNERCFFGI